MDDVTVQEAATILRVNSRRVRSLIDSGQLDAHRVGSQWTITVDSMDAHRALVSAGANSRPLSIRTGWGAAALLDAQGVSWLSSAEKTRLRKRLARTSTWQTWARWLGLRYSSIQRYQVVDTDISNILGRSGVVATGVSAADHLTLGLGTSGQADVYTDADLADELCREFFLVERDRGNLTVRTVDHSLHVVTAAHTAQGLVAARLMVAADLLTAGDSRAHRAGDELLHSLLRNNQTAYFS